MGLHRPDRPGADVTVRHVGDRGIGGGSTDCTAGETVSVT
jgi:hypothetical protein